MKYIIFLLLSIISIGNISAQKEANHWYFGINSGLDFTNATHSISPVVDTNGQLNTVEGCATISDISGNLLFYTDGSTVWNKNNAVMPNGSGLFGSSSSTQSAIIVPKPGNTNIYYIFTVDAQEVQPPASNHGLNLYTVDLTLDGGLGDVVNTAGTLNVTNLLTQPSSEKITAVLDANKTDFWVITLKINTFYAYKITAAGVDTANPITSTFATNFSGDRRGYLKVSPNGKFLASANMTSGFYLYDFDNATGIVSNPRGLSVPFSDFSSGPYGVAFSALSKKLYVSSGGFDSTHQTQENLYQYNLDIPNLSAANINNTRVLLHTYSNSRAALQLAPDGKIYRNVDAQSKLSVINNPDALGTAADYRHAFIDLGSTVSQQGLPPFIQSFFVADIQVVNTCFGDVTQFLVNSTEPIISMTTDFGDGSPTTASLTPTHTFTTTGNFTVSITITTAIETKIFTKNFNIYAVPTAATPVNWFACDDNNDGFFSFDLSQKDSEILNGQDPAIFSVNYYTDAALTQKITAPYTNINGYTAETIYVRVGNKNNLTCAATTLFDINVFDSPLPALAIDIPNIEVCDNALDGNDINGLATFDLTSQSTFILNGQSALDFDLTYFTDAALTNLIPNPTAFANTVANTQTIYVKVSNKLNPLCAANTSFKIVVHPLPVVVPTVTLKQCDTNTDGISDFNLTESEVLINNEIPTPQFLYYLNLADAQVGDPALAITNTSVFSNATATTVYVRVENSLGCFRVTQVNLLVSTTSIPSGFLYNLESCDDDGIEDGIANFDFTEATTAIKNIFPAIQNLVVYYYLNTADALAETNAIDPNDYRNEGSPFVQDIVVRIESTDNNACVGLGTHLRLTVNPLPQFDLIESQFVCLNDLPLTVSVTNPAGNYDYVWRDADGNIIGSNSSDVTFVKGGDYTVTAITTDGTLCSKTKSISITESVTATIDQFDIVDDSDNNSISIVFSGSGDYEVALDDLNNFIPFEPFGGFPFSHKFSYVEAGIHTVYIRDKNGCGLTIREAIIIGFPHFFTPNGDGVNDTWNVAGASLQPNSLIYIFDRFGKLIAKVDPTGPGWNGTLNGQKLPSSDYWFSAKLQDGRFRKGHFSLVRR
ncbi:MAG: T9SS type B sorting domain-containing protein [Flavobacteriaceae bacterium]|nr:T9SS type B sorting domain-containing protein [Flavobacteriaceae bacterium]